MVADIMDDLFKHIKKFQQARFNLAEGIFRGLVPDVMASIVSLSGGALVANIISVGMLVVETLMLRR